jgi:hypothetical protein
MTFLTIRRGQKTFFRFRQAGCFRRNAPYWRDRKQQRPLQEKQHRKTAGVDDRDDDQKPFQDGHQ